MRGASSLTSIALWRERLGISQRAAAEQLGMSLSAYQEQERGASFGGEPREASRVLLLACAAIEAGGDWVSGRR